MLKFIVLCVFIAIASESLALDVKLQGIKKTSLLRDSSTKGVVSHSVCGGDGVTEELRIDECEGSPCRFYGGRPYGFEIDFVTHESSDQVSMRLIVVITGIDVPLLDAAIPDSGVVAGEPYTLSYQITPDGLLAGQTILLKLEIYHTESKLLETCVSAPAEILME